MFEIGFWELALIFALGLVVLGPEKLPKVAAQLGRYAGQARRMARTLTAQIRDEIEAEERRITARESRPATPEPSYSRPGAEDLIPASGVEGAVEGQSASAPAATDTSAETAHRPQP
jgi:sec-independent protein translocase protein TatB